MDRLMSDNKFLNPGEFTDVGVCEGNTVCSIWVEDNGTTGLPKGCLQWGLREDFIPATTNSSILRI